MNKKNVQKDAKLVKPSRNKYIGRRTGVDVKEGKNIRTFNDGYENFDDYWTESEADSICDVSLRKKPTINKENLQNVKKNQACMRNKNIGRRTGKDVKAGKAIRRFKDGFENFDDYWSESDADSILSISYANRTGSVIPQKKSQQKVSISKTRESNTDELFKKSEEFKPPADKIHRNVDGNDAPTGDDQDTAKDDTDSAREREVRTGSESTASEIEDIRTASEHEEVEGAVSAASELEDVEREPLTTSKQHRVEDHPEDRPVRPEGGPVRPEGVQDRPEVVQDRPEVVQDRPKSGPVRPKSGPVRPEGGPVRPEGGPVRPEGGPVRPEGGLVTTSEQDNIKNSISITNEPPDPQRRKKGDGVSSSVNNQEGQKKHLTRSSQGRKGKGFISPQNGDSPVAVRGRQTGDTGVSAAGTSVDVQSVDHHSDGTCGTEITQTRHSSQDDGTCGTEITQTCHSSQDLQPTVDDVFNNRQTRSGSSKPLKAVKSGQMLSKSFNTGKPEAKRPPSGTVAQNTLVMVNCTDAAKKQPACTTRNSTADAVEDEVTTDTMSCESGYQKPKRNLNSLHRVNKTQLENGADIDKAPAKSVKQNDVEELISGETEKTVAMGCQMEDVSNNKQNSAESDSANEKGENLTKNSSKMDRNTNKKKLKSVPSKSSHKLNKKGSEEKKPVQNAETRSSTKQKVAQTSNTSVLDDQDELSGSEGFRKKDEASILPDKHQLASKKSMELKNVEAGTQEKALNKKAIAKLSLGDKENKNKNTKMHMSGIAPTHGCEPANNNYLSNNEKYGKTSKASTVSVNKRDSKTPKAAAILELCEDGEETSVNSQQSDSDDEDTPVPVAMVSGPGVSRSEGVSDGATSRSDSPISKLHVGGDVTGSLTKNDVGVLHLTNRTPMLSFRTRKRLSYSLMHETSIRQKKPQNKTLSYSLIHETSITQKKSQNKTKKQRNKTLDSESFNSSETDTNKFLCLSRVSLGQSLVFTHKDDDEFLIVDEDSDDGLTVKQRNSKKNAKMKPNSKKVNNKKSTRSSNSSEKLKQGRKSNVQTNSTESDAESEVVKDNEAAMSSKLQTSSTKKSVKNQMSVNRAKKTKTKSGEKPLKTNNNKVNRRKLSAKGDEPGPFDVSDSGTSSSDKFVKNKKLVKKSNKAKMKLDEKKRLQNENDKVKVRRLSNKDDEPDAFGHFEAEAEKNTSKNKKSLNKSKNKTDDKNQLPCTVLERKLTNHKDEEEMTNLSDSEPGKKLNKNKYVTKSRKTESSSEKGMGRISHDGVEPEVHNAEVDGKDKTASPSFKSRRRSRRVTAEKKTLRKGNKGDGEMDSTSDSATNAELLRTHDECADIGRPESLRESNISSKRKRKYSKLADTLCRVETNAGEHSEKTATKLSRLSSKKGRGRKSESSDHQTTDSAADSSDRQITDSAAESSDRQITDSAADSSDRQITDSAAESTKSGPSIQIQLTRVASKKSLGNGKLSKKKMNTKDTKRSLPTSEPQDISYSTNLSIHDSIRLAMTLPLEVPQSGVSLHHRSLTSETESSSRKENKKVKEKLPHKRLTTCLVQPGSVQTKDQKRRRVTINQMVESAFISPSQGSSSQDSHVGEDGTCNDSIVHFAEVTTSATPTAISSLKKPQIIFPKSPPEGLRRSQRTRVRPLEWYKNERLIYDRRRSGYLITGIQPSLEQKYLQKQKQTVRRLKKPKGLRRLSKGRLLHPTNLSIHVDLPENLDLTRSSEVPVLNPDNEQEMMLCCFSQNEQLESLPVCDKDEGGEEDCAFLVSHAIRQPLVNSGNLILFPLAEKKMQIVASQTLCFCVIYGKISVTIHRATCIVETGNHFFVPRGNSYSLKNLRNEDAKLAFFNFNNITEKD